MGIVICAQCHEPFDYNMLKTIDSEPPVCLVCRPSQGLDPNWCEECRDYMCQRHSPGGLRREHDVIAYVMTQLDAIREAFNSDEGGYPLTAVLMVNNDPESLIPTPKQEVRFCTYVLDDGEILDAPQDTPQVRVVKDVPPNATEPEQRTAFFDLLKAAAKNLDAYGCLIVAEAVLANTQEGAPFHAWREENPGVTMAEFPGAVPVVSVILEHRAAGRMVWVAVIGAGRKLGPFSLVPFAKAKASGTVTILPSTN